MWLRRYLYVTVFPQHLSSLSEKKQKMMKGMWNLFDTCGWHLYISFLAPHPHTCEFRLQPNIELQPAGQKVAVRMWSQLERMSASRYGPKTRGCKTPDLITIIFVSIAFSRQIGLLICLKLKAFM
jgi:hypothetical protein